MGLADGYVRDVWDQRRVFATYPPGDRFKVGDIVKKEHGVFKYYSDLSSRGFDASVTESGPVMPSWEVMAQSGVTISTKAKGATPKGAFKDLVGEADAGVHVEFSEEISYLMALGGVQKYHMRAQDELTSAVKTWFWDNKWDTSWVVVTEVWAAERSTILLSGETAGEIVLKASAELDLPAASGGKLAYGLEMRDQDNLAEHIVSSAGYTPVFTGMRVSVWDTLGFSLVAMPEPVARGAGHGLGPLGSPDLATYRDEFLPEHEVRMVEATLD